MAGEGQGIDEIENEQNSGPFEVEVDRGEAADVRAARLDAFLDRVESAPPGSCPCCGRAF